MALMPTTIWLAMLLTAVPYFTPHPKLPFQTTCSYHSTFQLGKSFINSHLRLGILNYGLVWVIGVPGPCRCCTVFRFYMFLATPCKYIMLFIRREEKSHPLLFAVYRIDSLLENCYTCDIYVCVCVCMVPHRTVSIGLLLFWFIF
jgi:hypothetical protein